MTLRLSVLAAFLATVVVAVAGAAPQALGWHVVLEESQTVTWGWTPDSAADGYRFYVNGTRVANTADPTRSTVRFGKIPDATYGMRVLLPGEFAEGKINEPSPPPPSPPPPLEVVCKKSNFKDWNLGGTNCAYNSVLTIPDNQQWRCPPVPQAQFPVKVVFNFTAVLHAGDQGYVDSINGCRGDPDSDTIDYIVESNGNFGRTGGQGPEGNAAKFRAPPGPTNIQITGRFECGPPGGGAHPDVWQFQNGSTTGNLAIVNGVSGDYDAGIATCAGAGGAIFWSDDADVDVIGGEYVTCNHGLNGNAGRYGDGNIVKDAKFRVSNQHPNCAGTVQTMPCINVRDLELVNVTCERRVGDAWVASAPQD